VSRLRAAESCLLVVDVQPKLAATVHQPDTLTANAAILMRAARRLDIPLLVSEQYPKGLGPTIPELAKLAPEGSVLEKLHFSCLGDPGFSLRFEGLGRHQAVLVGIEAHVCVLQTALDLLERRHAVFVVADAVSSRTPDNVAAALARLAAAGACVVTTEMVLFEWLDHAGTPEFRELSALIK